MRTLAKFIGGALTRALLRFLQDDPAKREGEVILLVTVDSGGWPHVALLSHWEVYATDDENIKVATYVGTTTTSNLKKNGKATLVLFYEGNGYYVKGSARLVREHLRRDSDNYLFNLEVASVLEDSMPGVRVAGANFEGVPGEEHGPLHEEIVEEKP